MQRHVKLESSNETESLLPIRVLYPHSVLYSYCVYSAVSCIVHSPSRRVHPPRWKLAKSGGPRSRLGASGLPHAMAKSSPGMDPSVVRDAMPSKFHHTERHTERHTEQCASSTVFAHSHSTSIGSAPRSSRRLCDQGWSRSHSFSLPLPRQLDPDSRRRGSQPRPRRLRVSENVMRWTRG
jgi:hypothetical protein